MLALLRAALDNAWQGAPAEIGADNVTLPTSATLAAQTGATTRELMARLGHASPRAALRYQLASTERDREVAMRLDAIFTRPRDGHGRAMEPDTNEAQIDETTPDLGI